jgi:SpoIIAA-like
MIKELTDLPAGVVGFEATGTLKAEDYRDVVLPALEQALASGDVRFVIVMPEFRGMSGGALWQDLKLGVEHFRAWKRIALVTDIDWMRYVTDLFGWMTPGQVKVFPLAQRGEAIAWAAGSDGPESGTTDRSA